MRHIVSGMTDQVGAAFDVVRRVLGTDVEAAYLYGSAVVGGLRPASDVDVLVLVKRRTTAAERRALAEELTPISDRRRRPPAWRPLELTVIALPDVRPWRYPAPVDFQWGEWLRADFESGQVPEPHVSPDLAVLIAMVRDRSEALVGPSAAHLLDEVPSADVDRAMREAVPALLEDLPTDTTNVLLTLARIWHSLTTGSFTSKDAAADWAFDRLPTSVHKTLEHARDAYLGTAADDWSGLEEDAARLGNLLSQGRAV